MLERLMNWIEKSIHGVTWKERYEEMRFDRNLWIRMHDRLSNQLVDLMTLNFRAKEELENLRRRVQELEDEKYDIEYWKERSEEAQRLLRVLN